MALQYFPKLPHLDPIIRFLWVLMIFLKLLFALPLVLLNICQCLLAWETMTRLGDVHSCNAKSLLVWLAKADVAASNAFWQPLTSTVDARKTTSLQIPLNKYFINISLYPTSQWVLQPHPSSLNSYFWIPWKHQRFRTISVKQHIKGNTMESWVFLFIILNQTLFKDILNWMEKILTGSHLTIWKVICGLSWYEITTLHAYGCDACAC